MKKSNTIRGLAAMAAATLVSCDTFTLDTMPVSQDMSTLQWLN